MDFFENRGRGHRWSNLFMVPMFYLSKHLEMEREFSQVIRERQVMICHA